MKRPHRVPLSKQAMGCLEKIRAHNQDTNLVFPNHISPNKCISENTILYALYRMGYHSRATGHGFRSTASTILNEMGFKIDTIESNWLMRKLTESGLVIIMLNIGRNAKV